MGGFDTVGVETGPGILRRVRSELAAVRGKERASQLTSCGVDVNDAEQVSPMARGAIYGGYSCNNSTK